MAKINKFPKAKRSSSCSDLSSTEIIYDIMSSDGENDESSPVKPVKSKLSNSSEGSIIYDMFSSGEETEETKQLDNTPFLPGGPCLPPKMRAKVQLPVNKKAPQKIWDLEALNVDRSIKFPIIIEVVEGMYEEDENNTYYTEDQLLIYSKPITSFVTCVNTKEQVFNIPIVPSYEIALVNTDSELNNKTNESVKNILGLKSPPNRIIANSQFEIDGVTIEEGQILEMNEFQEPNDKCLHVQTLSGEDIKLPRTLKNTFSCSVSGRSIVLPLAIESCIFPQRVVLTDYTCKGRTRKMLCMALECFSKTIFLACRYNGDVQSSLTSKNALVELPLKLGISFTIIGKPRDSNNVLKKLDLYSNKSVNVTKDVPVEQPKRSKSVSDLRYVIRPPSLQQKAKLQTPSSPQPQRINNFFQIPKDFDRCRTPPPLTNKPTKVPKIKMGKSDLIKELRINTAENIANLKQSPKKENKNFEPKNEKLKSEVLSRETKELITENKKLKEKVKFLENSLSQNKRDLGKLENALAEANSIIKEQKNTIIKMGLQRRSLPSIPVTGSAPNSPLMQGKEFPNKQKVLMSPPPLTTKPRPPQDESQNRSPRALSPTKPRPPQDESHIRSPRDLSPTKPRPPQDESHYKSPKAYIEAKGTHFDFEIKQDTNTAEYLGEILDKSNLSQYRNVFLEEGINMDIFTELNEQILEEELGVKAALHRKKLMKLAEKMKNREDISHFFVDPQYITGYRSEKIYEKL